MKDSLYIIAGRESLDVIVPIVWDSMHVAIEKRKQMFQEDLTIYLLIMKNTLTV